MVVACVNEDWQEPGQSTLTDPLVTVELGEGREHKQVEFLVVTVETFCFKQSCNTCEGGLCYG